MKLIVSVISIFVVCQGSMLLAAENSIDDLKVQLIQMADELKSNDHDKIKTFIKKYALEDDLSSTLTDDKIDKITEKFMKRKKNELMLHLQAASKMTPLVKEDQVTYEFLPKNDMSKTLRKDLVFKYSVKTKQFHIKN